MEVLQFILWMEPYTMWHFWLIWSIIKKWDSSSLRITFSKHLLGFWGSKSAFLWFSFFLILSDTIYTLQFTKCTVAQLLTWKKNPLYFLSHTVLISEVIFAWCLNTKIESSNFSIFWSAWGVFLKQSMWMSSFKQHWFFLETYEYKNSK